MRVLLPYPSFGLSVFFLFFLLGDGLKSLCGGGVPSSHPSLGLSVFFLSFTGHKRKFDSRKSSITSAALAFARMTAQALWIDAVCPTFPAHLRERFNTTYTLEGHSPLTL